MCKYLCRQAGKFLGGDVAKQIALVEQWINWNVSTLQPTCRQVLLGIFGGDAQGLKADPVVMEASLKNLLQFLKRIEAALKANNGCLTGDLSLADALIAVTLMDVFQTVLDDATRESLK